MSISVLRWVNFRFANHDRREEIQTIVIIIE